MARTKVQAELIATNAISGTIIADNAITATHIATNSISGTLVQDSGIVTSMIAANNITSTKIVTDAVLTRHIADDQVTAAKLANSINTDIATGPAALPKAGGTMSGNIVIADDSANTEKSLLIRNTTVTSMLGVEGSSANRFVGSAANNMFLGTTTADGIEFGTNNNVRAVIDSSGFVGVGTTTTNKIFNIADPAQGGETLKLHFEANSSEDKWEIYGYDRTNSHYTDMSFGNSAVYIQADKSVGIGTTSPAALLTLAGTTSPGLRIEDNGGAIAQMHYSEGNGYFLRLGNAANDESIMLRSYGVSAFMGGNVGIGTTSPDGPLHIKPSSGDTYVYLEAGQSDGNAGHIYQNSSGQSRGYILYDTDDDILLVQVNQAERIRIPSTGHLLINRTTTSVGGEGHRFDPNGESFHFADTASAMTTLHVYDTQDNAYRFYVDAAGGNAGRVNATNTTIQGISDIRLKENVRELEMGMNDLMKLKPRTFDWKEGEGTQKANVSGFIAQEAEAAGFEEFVGDYKHEKLKDAKSFGQGGLVPLLVKCIQELEIRVKELEG
jgi:hypothetical protein